jgi:hypothetical protein
MRKLVIETIKRTKWYSDWSNEYEGNPPALEGFTNEDLLEIYVANIY